MAYKKRPRPGKPLGPGASIKVRKTRYYTDEERAAALTLLACHGYDVVKTANELKMPRTTLRAWHLGFRHPEALRVYEEKRGDAAKMFETLVWEIMPFARNAMPSAGFRELMTGAGIAVDKMRLLKGESTAINDNRETSVNAELSKIVEAMTYDEREQFAELLRVANERRQQPAEPDVRRLEGVD